MLSKNRKKLVSFSSPGGKTVQLTKKSRSSWPEVFYKKGFLKLFQNSQENTCAEDSQGYYYMGWK